MNRKETSNLSSTTRLLGSVLLAIAFNLAFAFVLGSAPTQAQRYLQAHSGSHPVLAQSPATGRHHTWYA